MNRLGTVLFLLLPLVMASPAGALGQTPEAVAQSFASAWEAQDRNRLSGLLSAEGVHLRLDGDGHGGLQPRRVVAALESYWSHRSSPKVAVANVSTMEGGPPRAYGELSWRGVNDVTGERFEATIFIGLQKGDAGWRIDEVRTIAAG